MMKHVVSSHSVPSTILNSFALRQVHMYIYKLIFAENWMVTFNSYNQLVKLSTLGPKGWLRTEIDFLFEQQQVIF
jgi:hypothetical protein